MGKYADIADAAAKDGRRLRELIPDVYTAFAKLAGAVLADGALSRADKELIALSIAATKECDGCLAAHARAAVRAGVTRQQVAEAMGVVIDMNGGPGTVWGPRALAAFDEFAEATAGDTH